MSTSTATAYEYNVAGHLSFGAPKCEKAQKSSGFWANRTYRLCIKDNVLIDPCVGSGHFLVYAFDILMEVYQECGYIERDAVSNIVKHNLFGIDIDNRAAQLAYFAVMMKARQYDRRFLTRGISPNIYTVTESADISRDVIDYFINGDKTLETNLTSLLDDFKDAKEYGSLINVTPVDFTVLYARCDEIIDDISIFKEQALNEILPFLRVAEVLSKRYAAVTTNPPYLNKHDAKLKTFINDNYADYKGDLFSVFMYRNFGFCKENGYSSFMTPNVWMFIKTYEGLRKYLIDEKSIVSLIQMAKGAFFKEATVDICAFILKNAKESANGLYFRLEDFKGDMEVQRVKTLEAIRNKDCGYFYEASEENFSKIPGSPIAYWVSETLINSFKYPLLGQYIVTREGMATADNDRFLRNWHEVSINQITFNAITPNDVIKWVPYNKGADFRKWYGNNDFIVNWENDGIEIKSNIDKKTRRIRSHNYNGEYGFRSGATWSSLSSGSISLRFCEEGFLFDSKGAKGFSESELPIESFIALVNSKVATAYLSFISPTIDFKVGDIILIPVCQKVKYDEKIKTITSKNIIYSRSDWDSFETSWDFKRNPLV